MAMNGGCAGLLRCLPLQGSCFDVRSHGYAVVRKAAVSPNFPALRLLARQIWVTSGLLRFALAFGAHRLCRA